MITLTEVEDGLLVSDDKVMMKARCPELFPTTVKGFFDDKIRIPKNKIECGIHRVTIRNEDKSSVFDAELFKYIKQLGKIECYLSNVPLPCDDAHYYPMFAKYKHGWVCLAPLEAV